MGQFVLLLSPAQGKKLQNKANPTLQHLSFFFPFLSLKEVRKKISL